MRLGAGVVALADAVVLTAVVARAVVGVRVVAGEEDLCVVAAATVTADAAWGHVGRSRSCRSCLELLGRRRLVQSACGKEAQIRISRQVPRPVLRIPLTASGLDGLAMGKRVAVEHHTAIECLSLKDHGHLRKKESLGVEC